MPTISGQTAFIDRKGEQVHSLEQAKAIAAQPIAAVPIIDEDDEESSTKQTSAPTRKSSEESEADIEAADTRDDAQPDDDAAPREGVGRGRRRRRRGRRGEAREGDLTQETAAEHAVVHAADDEGVPAGG